MLEIKTKNGSKQISVRKVMLDNWALRYQQCICTYAIIIQYQENSAMQNLNSPLILIHKNAYHWLISYYTTEITKLYYLIKGIFSRKTGSNVYEDFEARINASYSLR